MFQINMIVILITAVGLIVCHPVINRSHNELSNYFQSNRQSYGAYHSWCTKQWTEDLAFICTESMHTAGATGYDINSAKFRHTVMKCCKDPCTLSEVMDACHM